MHVQSDRHISSGGYSNNVKCMYTSVPGHIVDCSEFRRGIDIAILVSYLQKNQLAYVAYSWH